MIACTRYFLAFIFLSLCSQLIASQSGNGLSEEEEELFAQRDQIYRQMNSSEQVRHIRITQRIREARSDISSGEFLVQTQPSAMDPRRDVQAERRRGQAMIEQGQKALLRERRAMVEFLQSVQERVEAEADPARRVRELAFSLKPQTWENVFEVEIHALLEEAIGADFGRTFFSGILFSADDLEELEMLEIESSFYEKMLEIDGDRLVMGQAFEPQIRVDDTANSEGLPVLHFENLPSGDFLVWAVEVLDLDGADSEFNVLSLRLFDPQTCQTFSSRLLIVPPVRALIEDEAGAEPVLATGQLDVTLTDTEGLIARLRQVPQPYTYAVVLEQDEPRPHRDRFERILLSDVLLNHGGLNFGESRFIRNQFPTMIEESDDGSENGRAWQRIENARIILSDNEETGERNIDIQPIDRDTRLRVGTLRWKTTAQATKDD